MRKIISALCLFLIASLSLPANNTQRLQSKDFAILLRSGDFGLQYKAGLISEIENNPSWHSLSLGKIEGKTATSFDFLVQDVKTQEQEKGVTELTYELRHKRLPLSISLIFSSYSTTGVMSQKCVLKNTGDYAIHFEDTPSLNIGLASGNYDYTYMTVSWSHERKMVTKPLEDEGFTVISKAGRSSAEYSPWISLHDKDRNIYYIAQLAWSGNWTMNLGKKNNNMPELTMSEYFDNGSLVLMPDKTFHLPEAVFSGAYGSIDEAANKLHDCQRKYIIPLSPKEMFMPVQFNSWFPLQQNITAENLIPYIDKAAELGCEAFTIDAGWFTKKAWDREAGDWQTNLKAFPKGMGQIADHVRSRGMKFGLWFELESLGDRSDMYDKHPDWCLQRNGRPATDANRRHLDYSNPEVFEWALKQFANMYEECKGIDWVKLDYNISIGSEFENGQGIKTGQSLRSHITSYYNWLDTLRSRYPTLLVENCSSGAMRLDMGIAKHSHTSFISDETSPNPSLGMAWSSTLEYIPRALNHWVVGMGNHYAVIDQSLPQGYWDYMFKIPMNGQYGISSKVLDWSPELQKCAIDNVKLFKRIRSVIADADCYHLTPQPDFTDPTGWTAIQYVQPDIRKSVVMLYRTRTNESTFTAKLRGLDNNSQYLISIDGSNKGVYTGKALQESGFTVSLNNEYRACVLELEAI